MKTLTNFPAVCDLPAGEFLLSRPRARVEPFMPVARGAAPLPFAAEILSARAELARRYNARGFALSSNGIRP